MAQAVAAIVIKAAGTSLSTGAAAAITAAAAVTDIAIAASYQKKQEADARKAAASAPRDVMVRSAIEPSKIVYGRARVSGPVVYTNTKPTPGTNDNNTLWTVVSLASHECDDIEAIWLDGDEIPSAIIDWAGTGGVTSGTYGPISGNEVTNFYRRLGSDTQSHVSELASAFSDWTTSHVGKGTCYVVSAFELGTRTGEGVWSNGAPQSIRAVVKGKKVYDPRLDSTNGGSGTHRLADPTTWEWSDNPALCLADYLFDADLGMGAEGVSYSDIDWAMVATAADQCDATVTSPSGNQKRFTCNGVLDTGTAYADNIRNLLSAMAGTLTWSGGKYRIRAAAYEAPTFTFTENDIVGDVQVQPERPRAQRFNTVRGTFIDPSADYAATQFLRVQDSDYLSTRDKGQELTTSIALPMTNDEYMAQRLAWRSLRLANQQTTAVVPLNWKALKVGVGDRINLTVSELSWSSKVFVVDAWSFDPEKGFMLTVREDSSSAYADPALGDYSTRTAAGVIAFNDPAVPSPSGLSATSEEEGILLEWEAPSMPSMYDEVVIYASPDSAWANAVEVGRVRGTRFRHELTRGTTRYYWARSEDVDGRESIRDPDSDTSAVTATAGQIATSQLNDDADFALTADWPSVGDSAGTRPVNNATNNGATIDESGNIVGDVETTTNGKLYAGKSTYGSSTAGWLFEYNGGTPRFDVGNGTDYIRWDGTTLTISGGLTVTSSDVINALGYTPYDSANPDSYIDGTQVNANVTSISGGVITTGTVNADRISIDGITIDTDGSGNLIIKDGGVGTTQLGAGAVTADKIGDGEVSITKFASGITPVQVVGTLPSTADQGDQAFLTTDNKLYRYNGTSWVASIPLADVTGTGALAALDDITLAKVTDSGALASRDDVTLSLVTDAGTLAALDSIAETNIDDDAITETKIKDDEISTNKLKANAVTAAKIAANTITAAQIAAGAIVTSKLAVTARGAALNSDPNMQDSSAWSLWNGEPGTFEEITDGVVGNNVLRSGTPDSLGSWYNGSEKLALDPSKTYRMTALARKSASANGRLYLGVAAFDDSGNNISGDGTQWSYDAANNIAGSTDWTRYTMEFGAGTAQTFPANAVTFSPIAILNYSSTAGYFEAQDIRIEEKVNSSLIVDGAVITDKLAANAVTAAKIAAGTITANEILGNTITANEIAAGTITATEIAAATITGAKIAANTIEAANIAANTITSSEIAANTITAGEIAAGAIGADEIAANAVTAEKINVTNLAAITADLGTVTAGSLASSLITGDISTFVTFADTSSQTVIEDDGETVIQTFLLPGNSLGLQPIIIATAYFNYNTGMDQNGKLVFRVRQGQNSTTGTVVSTLIIHTRRQSGVIESGSINIIGVDSTKSANQYYSITVDVDSGNLADGATFSNVRGVVIGGR